MAGLHHLALRARDCGASARFYEEAFGLREIRRFGGEDGPRAVWLQAGDTVLMIERSLRGGGSAEGSGHVLVFPTEDLVAAESRLRERGIAIADRTPNTLYVLDPDGHRAGVSNYVFDETPRDSVTPKS